MLVKTFYPYDETFSKDLCVLPNDGESQYEAFQSIFAVIMSASFKSSKKKKRKHISPYEMLCKKYKIKLIPSTHTPDIVGPGKRIIWYVPEAETHYIANVDGIEYDPYNELQAINTQGFCQMFAFILAIGDVDGFIPADQTKKINETNFNILAHNTQLCCTKSLLYLESNSEIQAQFEKDFSHLMINERVERGLKEGTTLTQYLNDFKTIFTINLCMDIRTVTLGPNYGFYQILHRQISAKGQRPLIMLKGVRKRTWMAEREKQGARNGTVRTNDE
jgi:hypothetical protein